MRARVRILCCCVKTLRKFIHSTLLQFTQLYEYLAIDSGGHVYKQPSCIIVAYGWMLPREAEMVSE